MRDPSEFRERFQRWKNGEQVYENGIALPAYKDGKDSVSYYPEMDASYYATHRLYQQDKPLSPADPLMSTYVEGVALTPAYKALGWAIKPLRNVAGKLLKQPTNQARNVISNIIPAAMSTVNSVAKNTYKKAAERLIGKGWAEEILRNPEAKSYWFFPKSLQGVDKVASEDIQKLVHGSTTSRIKMSRAGGIKINYIKDDIQKMMDRGYTEYPKEIYEKYHKYSNGTYWPKIQHISIKRGSANKALPHEIRHRIDDNIPLTYKEKDFLSAAYDENFIKTIPETNPHFYGYDMGPEGVATNFDSRRILLGDDILKNTPVGKQNILIDDATDNEIFNAVSNSNGYGQAYIDLLDSKNLLTHNKANQFRDAMKYVGAVSSPIGLYNYINNQK